MKAFLKTYDLDKENYRSGSVLFNVSKIFERIIYSQTDTFIQDKLSNPLTGFKINHRTQQCLMYMHEIWKNLLDEGDMYVLSS